MILTPISVKPFPRARVGEVIQNDTENRHNVTTGRRAPGTVLASRRKGAVEWQARISDDRGRLEVIGIVPPSATATVIQPLNELELRELLGEGADLDGGVSASRCA